MTDNFTFVLSLTLTPCRLVDDDGSIQVDDSGEDVVERSPPIPPVPDPKPGAGLIEWLKSVTLDYLENLHVPPIIPGINDIMVDEVGDVEADIGTEDTATKRRKHRVRRSRGLRGAEEIASAAKSALLNIGKQFRLKQGSDNHRYCQQCFDSPVLLPADRDYFEQRRTPAMVMELARGLAERASQDRWTPLIPVEDVDPVFEEERREYIASSCKTASALGKLILQRRGHNVVGQVINHENFTSKISQYGKKRSGVGEGDGLKQAVSEVGKGTKKRCMESV